MAIVIRTKRDFDFIPKINSKLGPGEYEKEFINKKTYNQFHNSIPFNSSKERMVDDQNKSDSNLGPGYYYQENHNSFIKKSFSKNNLEDIKEQKLYDMSLFNLINKEKYEKLNEIKGLNIDKENSSQVKNSSKIINIKNKFKSQKKSIKLIPTTLTKNRLTSIPSKQYYLGYYFDENGISSLVDTSIEKNKYIINNKTNNIKDNHNKNNNSLNWSKINKNDIILCPYLNKNKIKKILLKKNILNHPKKKANNLNDDTNKSNNCEILISNSSTNNTTNYKLNKLARFSDKSSKIIFSNKYLNSMDSFFYNNSNKINNSTYENISFYNNKTSTPKVIQNKIKGNYYKLMPKAINHKIKADDKKFEIKNINNLSDSDIQDIVCNTFLSSEPGPGYYSNKSIFDKYQLIRKDNKKYNFGTNEKRKLNIVNSTTSNNLGPGSYFKIDNIKKLNKTTLSPFNRKEKIITKNYSKKVLDSPKMFSIFSKTEISPEIGPGKYEFKSQFNKTQKSSSGPHQIKFFDIMKKIKPGPGEYLPLSDWENKNKKEPSKKKLTKFLKIKNKLKKIYKKKEKGRHGFIPESDNPEVGIYNPQLINSIGYNIIFNSKLSNLYAPFCTSEDKLKHKNNSTPENVGPGSYIINNSDISFNNYKSIKINDNNKSKLNIVIKDIEKRERIKLLYNEYKQKMKNNIGPGTYENPKYNDWNKKSFNILYI